MHQKPPHFYQSHSSPIPYVNYNCASFFFFLFFIFKSCIVLVHPVTRIDKKETDLK